jgi:NAD(P)H-hydrate epimerase
MNPSHTPIPDPALAGLARLHDAEGSRALDALASERHGIPGIVLMRRAGMAAFRALRERWPGAASLTVLCGRGNNAGDGYVIAGIARGRGLAVQLLQVTDAADLKGDAATARDWALDEGVEIEPFAEGAAIRGEVVVDALLGTGIKGEVRPEFREALDAIAAAGRPVLAVDIPSGLSADTGAVLGAAVRADATVTFIAGKRGLFTGAGRERCGEIVFDDLGLPEALYADPDAPAGLPLLRLDDLRLPPRPADAHKGAHGHVLVLGGDVGTGGATIMAAEAALACGAGLVSMGTRGVHLAPALARAPEVMVRPVEHRTDLAPLLERAGVIVVGPGLGTAPWGEQVLDAALEAGRPLVVDADALNRLAALEAAPRRDDWILTPHPGEAARLLGTDTASVNADRFAAVTALHERFGGAVVLKGSGSLVADADGLALCPDGNPGMASGGMGDVLSGVLGALLAQGLAPGAAARLSVCVHGAAGDAAAALTGETALRATDLRAHLGPLVGGRGPA